ncbi:MAG: TspO/MBR family protein [Methanosarcina sp.]
MLGNVNIFKLITSIVICLLSGVIGSVFTASSIENWYVLLEKPALNPPSWIFSPVWTILYILMGISLYLVWEKGLQYPGVKFGITIFAIQLVLNTLWSIVFFGLRNPFYGFIEIIFLWIAIVITIWQFYKISKTASYLLLPYLLWVTFATYLTYSIWILNP